MFGQGFQIGIFVDFVNLFLTEVDFAYSSFYIALKMVAVNNKS